MLSLILQGLLIGFSIAAPVGPIGILCIQRTIQKGFFAGFITGFGAAIADAMYGCIAGFGLTIISRFLINYALYINLIGGLLLLYLGIKTIFARPITKTHGLQSFNSYWKDLLSTVILTLSNPMTIISFAAIFAGMGIGNQHRNFIAAMVLVFGVLLGSLLWWLILSGIFSLKWVKPQQSWRWLNPASGLILIGFGSFALSKI